MLSDSLKVIANHFRQEMMSVILAETKDVQMIEIVNQMTEVVLLELLIQHSYTHDAVGNALSQIQHELEGLPF